jgi:heat-inducible transcriptional repressor
MTLDKRKLQVLHAIIQNYIVTGEPVGSRTISKNYDLGVSSATIRNEMSDLEDLGLLVQPYTSSGRIPSDRGYRLYVNGILPLLEKEMKEYNSIGRDINQRVNHIEELLKTTLKILSDYTNYTTIALAPQTENIALKNIQVIKIDRSRIMVVLVSDSGNIQNQIFRLEEEVDEEQLVLINNFLNAKLRGTDLDKVKTKLSEDEKFKHQNSSASLILPIIANSIQSIKDSELYLEGISNILNFPEYSDMGKVKQFLDFIEDKQKVMKLFAEATSSDVEVKIGSENLDEEMKGCSIITAVYTIDGSTIGKLGIVGPTRMDYLRIMAIIKNVTEELNHIIKEYLVK